MVDECLDYVHIHTYKKCTFVSRKTERELNTFPSLSATATYISEPSDLAFARLCKLVVDFQTRSVEEQSWRNQASIIGTHGVNTNITLACLPVCYGIVRALYRFVPTSVCLFILCRCFRLEFTSANSGVIFGLRKYSTALSPSRWCLLLCMLPRRKVPKVFCLTAEWIRYQQQSDCTISLNYFFRFATFSNTRLYRNLQSKWQPVIPWTRIKYR